LTKIKFNEAITGFGSPDRIQEHSFSFAPDQVADIEDELASAWCESGIATRVPVEAPVAEYATSKPTVSKAAIKAPAIKSGPDSE